MCTPFFCLPLNVRGVGDRGGERDADNVLQSHRFNDSCGTKK